MKISAILLATVALAQNAYLPTTSGTISTTDYQTTTTETTTAAHVFKIPLKCWHCDAMSFEECANKGQEETCLVS